MSQHLSQHSTSHTSNFSSSSPQTICCLGPGPKFKGGIANFTSSLAKTFDKLGHEVHLISWSQQYPALIPRQFESKKKSAFLADTNVQVQYLLNYNNPFTWRTTVKEILALQPAIVIIQWSISLQGLPLYFIAKELKKHSEIRVIYDLHFVIQKEKSLLDDRFTKPFLKLGEEFITHSNKTTKELVKYFPNEQFVFEQGETDSGKRIIELYHPIYSVFEREPSFNADAFKESLGLKKHVFLFFGFIRKYKGLHNTIRAFKQLEEQRDDVSLLICGESFWDTLDSTRWSTKLKKAVFGTVKKVLLPKNNDEHYQPLELLTELNVQNVVVKNEYIPNEDVSKYFQASDATVLFYDNSSPSGVESLSYNFGKPILATKVGHFPETVINGVNGYLANAGDINDMAATMKKLIEQPIDEDNIELLAEKLSWQNYAKEILSE